MMAALSRAMSGVWTRNAAPSTPARVASAASCFERCDELRPAIRIAGIVQRVHADDDVGCADDFGPAERKREHDRVPRRHVGGRNPGRSEIAIARDSVVRRQRRAADCP